MPLKFRIDVYNAISRDGPRALSRAARYIGRQGVADARRDPRALARHARHGRFPRRVKAIGRAGAGTNNIPVAAMSQRGVPVFNAPGANANAVKELVLAAHADRGAQPRPRARLRATRSTADDRPREARSRTARSSSPASSCPGARSASSAWAPSAASSPTRRSSSA